jgi:alkaline phosphatase D
MASIRAPGLGPIIGHTTDTTCRVWIRGGDPGDTDVHLDANRRTVGIVGVVEGKRQPRIGRAWYFRLQREFDRTGTFVLGSDVQLGHHSIDFADQGIEPPEKLPSKLKSEPLEPDTEYTIRVATLTVDDPMPDDESLPDWELIKRLPDIEAIKGELLNDKVLKPEESEGVFRTFSSPDSPDDRLTFLLGSCRYPGLLWKIKEADRIFGPMLDHFASDNRFGDRARFTMMCGDQIYADALNKNIPILRADTFQEFQERYMTAFGAMNLRRLLRQSTSYMILDDHEIEDNWSQDRIDKPAGHQLFTVAIGAYFSYQWSHGPRTWGRQLYYTFECGAFPFFVVDTRTHRYKDDEEGLADNHLLGRPSIDPAFPGQLNCLLEWLERQQDKRGDAPKFVVTSSVFVPNSMNERLAPAREEADEISLFQTNKKRRDKSDSWPAFPSTRRAVLERIVEKGVQNVVFLSGDIHCSNVAEMSFEGPNAPGRLKAFSVTSSAFYWPFPFAVGDPNDYVHDSRLPDQHDPFPVGDGVTMHYRSHGYTQEDNFCRLELDRASHALTVRVYDRKGRPVTVTDFNGAKHDASVLSLAPW